MGLPIWAREFRRDQPIMFYFSSLQCIWNVVFICIRKQINLLINNEICDGVFVYYNCKDKVEKTYKIVASVERSVHGCGPTLGPRRKWINPFTTRLSVTWACVDNVDIRLSTLWDLPIPCWSYDIVTDARYYLYFIVMLFHTVLRMMNILSVMLQVQVTNILVFCFRTQC